MRWPLVFDQRGVAGGLLAVLLGVPACAEAQGVRSRYEFDPHESTIVVVTHRGGVLKFLGHEHAIIPRSWSGHVCWAGASPLTATGTVIVDSRTLVIDSDSARRSAHLGGGPSAEQVKTIQARLHDAQHLNTAEYPQLRFDADTVLSMQGDRADIAGVLTIRDITRRARVPVQITATAEGKLRFSGSLRVRQSDFGIRPESVAGVVRVADAIDIRLDLTGVSTGAVCQ